ncbi:MAG TPA: DUF2520 domain-containing protein [Vicinamibacterales bacterium]|jgi:predicted short-subunit dehydrogenase-like oxidoreductase (DUF2520 family)|nr:DUF2520 domain-containing protein [Vicinamibacterales bacterium]
MESTRLAFVGGGPVASTLARAMHRAGLQITAIASRNRVRAAAIAAHLPGTVVAADVQQAVDAADLVFLTVPDDAIQRVCESATWRAGTAVVHCSGATEVSALAGARAAGALTGAFHPLQMFANPDVALTMLPGCTITIDAQAPLDRLLEDLCRRIGCRPVHLPGGQRALYHASANYVGPFVIALMQEAVEMWRALGASDRDALEALIPLLRGTIAAVEDGGLARGMGGCVARGDVGTVRRHVAAITSLSPGMATLYRHLTLRTIPLGIARGTLSPERAAEIRAMVEARRLEEEGD